MVMIMGYYDDYLEHSLKGSQRKNHKYKSRTWKNGRWKYFYDTKITGKEYKNKQDDAAAQQHQIQKSLEDTKTVRDANSRYASKDLESIKGNEFERRWMEAEVKAIANKHGFSPEKVKENLIVYTGDTAGERLDDLAKTSTKLTNVANDRGKRASEYARQAAEDQTKIDNLTKEQQKYKDLYENESLVGKIKSSKAFQAGEDFLKRFLHK